MPSQQPRRRQRREQLEAMRRVHLLAWRMGPVRAPTNPWLVPGLVAGLTVILATAGVQVAVRAVRWLALSLAMPRPAGVAWTALVPAGLNATLWERRQPTGEHGRRRGG